MVVLPEPYADEEESDDIQDSKTKPDEKAENKLVFRRFPWACWILGLLNLVGSFFLLYRLTIGRYQNSLFIKRQAESKWWHILLTVFLFLVAICLLLAGKVETVTIDKVRNRIELRKTTMVCIKKETVRNLSDLFAFNGFKKGHEGAWMSTVEFVIKAEFKRERSVTVLTSRSR